MENTPNQRGARTGIVTGFARAAAARKKNALSRTNPSSGDARVDATPGTQKTWRLCVLEDSYAHLRAITHAFRERGYALDHFSSVEDAWQALHSKRYDAAILSDTMADGADACDRAIKLIRGSGDERVLHMPLLILATRSQERRSGAWSKLTDSALLHNVTEPELIGAMASLIDKPPSQRGTQVTGRVLIVDDSYARSVLLKDAAARSRREADHVSSIAEAIQALDRVDYGVVMVSYDRRQDRQTLAQFIEYIKMLPLRGKAAPQAWVIADGPGGKSDEALRLAGAQHVVDARHAADLVSALTALLETPAPAVLTTTMARGIEGRDDGGRRAISHRMRDGARRAVATMKRVAVYSAAMALVTAGAWAGWHLFEAARPVDVAIAHRGVVEKVVPVNGHVISQRQVDLAPLQTGQIYRVFLHAGDLVRKGETLATLDNRDAVIAVRRAEAEVFRYRTEINLAEKAMRSLREAGRANRGPSGESELQAERSIADAKLRVAQQELRAAQLLQDKLAIVAPFSGQLQQATAVEGKWVREGDPQFTLVDLSAVEIVLHVDTRDAQEFAVGQAVHLRAENPDHDTWDGQIDRVVFDSLGAYGAVNTGTSGVAAHVAMTPDAPVLAYGTRVEGRVVTQIDADDIVVPLAAIEDEAGTQTVWVAVDKVAEKRRVEVAMRGLHDAAIRSGLADGEHVIVAPGPLQQGQRVVARNESATH